MSTKPYLFYIEFNGKSYPAREVCLEDNDYTISVSSLNEALLDGNGNYVSENAKNIDEDIFYYLEDSDIEKPDEEIIKILEDNL